MTVETLLDRIERRLGRAIDHYEVMSLVEESLGDLSLTDQFEFLKVNLQPVLQTEPDVREYDLPTEFPANFIRTGNPHTGSLKYSVIIDDGTSTEQLDFETMEVFYLRDLSQESSTRPTHYTIRTGPGGVKQIVLSRPPNSTSYTISGTYMPNEYQLELRDELPPIPNFEYLVYDALRQLDPNPRWEESFRRARRNLYYIQAKQHPAHFSVERDPALNLMG